MDHAEPARTATAVHRPRSPASSPGLPACGLTIYGCGPDEAALFRELAPRFGVAPTITEAPVSEANVDLAAGNRCVSVSHQTPVTGATLRALRRTGVRYLSTRSVGYDHIDVALAARIGMTVANVTYSPDSVADYTLMLMLMAVRDARSILRRVEVHDYRLGGHRGRELRDLTVGVVGTGRIGAAVVDRLRGFGCRVLASDHRPKTSATYVAPSCIPTRATTRGCGPARPGRTAPAAATPAATAVRGRARLTPRGVDISGPPVPRRVGEPVADPGQQLA